jgi:putative endonuclease
MAFYTYAVYSEKYRKIYIGFTHNIEERLIDHNYRAKKGFTVRFRPWVLVYTEEFQNKTEAMRREKELKSFQGRQFIWKQVEQYFAEKS